MLVLCYGITKSGSTLAFEMVKAVLESAGYAQTRLPRTIVASKHAINYVEPLDRERIETLLSVIGPERRIAVKTHAGFGTKAFGPRLMLPFLEELHAKGTLQIIASYRDPRDICLSLIDAGVAARAKGIKEFSTIVDLESAIENIERQIRQFEKWAAVRWSLRLDYEMVAFAPDVAVRQIATKLGVVCNVDSVIRYVFEQAFTRKNKGQQARFKTELRKEQKKRLRDAFGPFIRRVCKAEDEAWFKAVREKVLTGSN